MPFWKRETHQNHQQYGCMEWYNSVAEVLEEIRAHKSAALKVKINSAQSFQLAYAFSAKLAKFWPKTLSVRPPAVVDPESSPKSHGHRNRKGGSPGSSTDASRPCLSRVKSEVSAAASEIVSDSKQDKNLAVLGDCKHALKEVFRVVKELEVFLKACSREDWWNTALLQADNGEALTVHLHDLVWSVAALDVAVHLAEGCTLESVDAVYSRRVAECYAEMGRSHHFHNESMDRKQLVSMLTSLGEQFSQLNRRRKRTLWPGDENKHRISEFLLQRLRSRLDTNTPPPQGSFENLFIDPRHIDFSKRRLLGRGAFGAVYAASWFGMDIAVKELPHADEESFKEEASILAKLRCPFIVQLVGWSLHQEANACYMVMELCSDNLRSHIEKRFKNGSPFSLRVAVDIMLQIARGMEYLHSQRVIHRDLRASNVLVMHTNVTEFLDEGYVRVKLCDFGMAKAKLNTSRFISSMKGATYWRAPEVFSDPGEEECETIKRHYTDKADVYSFAMTCYEILTGQVPFRGVLYKEVYQYVMNGGRPDLPAYCPSVLTDYIKKCWHGDDKCRPTFQDICKVLRHVKLVLMRVDDPKDVSFRSVTTEVELSNHLQSVSLSGCGERSFKESTNPESQQNVTELELYDPSFPGIRTRQTPMQRVRSLILFRGKPMGMEPKEDAMFTSSIPSFIVKYTHHDLRTATANFSEMISESTCVFRGVLPDGSVVAVKVVQVCSEDDAQSLSNMVLALANAYHTNLARFRGYCKEESCFFFVYDYMVNLSLDKWLLNKVHESTDSSETDSAQGDCLLDWRIRLKIAVGAARGLAFLHEDCGQYLIPVCPISSKILLSEQFEAKINTLNLFEGGRKCQIASHKISSRKSENSLQDMSSEVTDAQSCDVYSFGVTLFELFVGSSVEISKIASDEGLVSVLDKPAEFLELLVGQMKSLNPLLTGYEKIISGLWDRKDVEHEGRKSQAVQKARTLFQTAMWCVQNSKQRPTISQVVQTLEGSLSIPPPVSISLDSYRELGII